jgi:hypothetical protein
MISIEVTVQSSSTFGSEKINIEEFTTPDEFASVIEAVLQKTLRMWEAKRERL